MRRTVLAVTALSIVLSAPACAAAPETGWRPSRDGDQLGVQVALLEGVLGSTALYAAARGVRTVCVAPVRERGVRWDATRLRPESEEAALASRRLVGLVRIPYREVVPFYECQRGGEGGWAVLDGDGDPAVLVYTTRWAYETDELVEASVTVQRSRRDALRFTCLLDRVGRGWQVGPCTCNSDSPGRCERVGPIS